MSSLIEKFREMSVPNITDDQFVQYVDKFLNKQDQVTTIEQLENAYSKEDIIFNVVDFFSRENNIPNPLAEKWRAILKDHDFFKNRAYTCAAPFTTLRFEKNGAINVCCSSGNYTIGTYPETGPLNAWIGPKINELKKALSNYDFSKGCMKCAYYIAHDTGHAPMLTEYDVKDVVSFARTPFPRNLVFQFHNTCNYECIMCGGDHSSLIRKNRDFLPPMANVYDDRFFKEITPLIRYAETIEILGGEPFLQSNVYKLCDIIKLNNTNAKVTFVTNGSVYNSRVRDILADLPNATVSVSLDSINPKTYAFIRRNGNLKDVLANIDKFIALKKNLILSMCPLIQNVYEIPDFIDFCIKKNATLWISEVEFVLDGRMYEDAYENGFIKRELPDGIKLKKIPEFRLWKLPLEEREKIKVFLLKKQYPEPYQNVLNSFIGFLMSGT